MYGKGNFKNLSGSYTLSSERPIQFNGGISLEFYKNINTYKVFEAEGSILPTDYVLSLPPNPADSVYLPRGVHIHLVDLSGTQLMVGFGIGKVKQIKNKLAAIAALIPFIAIADKSVGDTFSEGKKAPYMVGSRQDIILEFNMHHQRISPGLRARGNLSLNLGLFQLNLSPTITYYIRSQVKGKYQFFPNLAEESKGDYRSSHFAAGLNFGLSIRLCQKK